MKLRHPRFALLLIILCGLAVFGGVLSSARKFVADEPASQGRPITPAGAFVPDQTTQQTAVAPLTVDFVRSPDTLGPNGEGRYLIAVNSGYGVQFSGAGNKGQQSISV